MFSGVVSVALGHTRSRREWDWGVFGGNVFIYLLYSDTGFQSLASGKQNCGMALRRCSASLTCLVGLSSCEEEDKEEEGNATRNHEDKEQGIKEVKEEDQEEKVNKRG